MLPPLAGRRSCAARWSQTDHLAPIAARHTSHMATSLRATFHRDRDRQDANHFIPTGPLDPEGLATRWECLTPFGTVRETWVDSSLRSTIAGPGIPRVSLSCDDPRNVVRANDLRHAPQPLTLVVASAQDQVAQPGLAGPLWSPATLLRSFTRDGRTVQADVPGVGTWTMRAQGSGSAVVRRGAVELLRSNQAATRLVLADSASPTDLAVGLALILTLRHAIFPSNQFAD